MKYFKKDTLKIKLKNIFLIIFFILILSLLLKPKHFLEIKLVNSTIKDLGFSLKNIDVEGNYFVKKQEIIKNINFINCENLFCLDLKKSKDLIESNNWIKSVKLRLILPSKLKVVVNEEKPYFIYKNNKKLVLLNIEGNEIDKLYYINDKFKDLVVLKGEGAIDNIPNLLNILDLNEDISAKVTEARLVAKRRWSLKYLSNVTIDLPEKNPEKAFYKITELEKKYGFLSSKLKKIDLRISDRMIIQLQTLVSTKEESQI